MPVHEFGDTVKIIAIVFGAVFLIVIALGFIFEHTMAANTGIGLINTIVAVPESLFNFISNGINAVSQFLIHLLHSL